MVGRTNQLEVGNPFEPEVMRALVPDVRERIAVVCGSQPMINAQKRNVSQSRFKHMKTKHHYIRKLIFDGWCKLVKIPTKMNIGVNSL